MFSAYGHRPAVMSECGCIYDLYRTGMSQIWPLGHSSWTLKLEFEPQANISSKDIDLSWFLDLCLSKSCVLTSMCTHLPVAPTMLLIGPPHILQLSWIKGLCVRPHNCTMKTTDFQVRKNLSVEVLWERRRTWVGHRAVPMCVSFIPESTF